MSGQSPAGFQPDRDGGAPFPGDRPHSVRNAIYGWLERTSFSRAISLLVGAAMLFGALLVGWSALMDRASHSPDSRPQTVTVAANPETSDPSPAATPSEHPTRLARVPPRSSEPSHASAAAVTPSVPPVRPRGASSPPLPKVHPSKRPQPPKHHPGHGPFPHKPGWPHSHHGHR